MTGPVRFVVQGIAEGLTFSVILCVLGVVMLYIVR